MDFSHTYLDLKTRFEQTDLSTLSNEELQKLHSDTKAVMKQYDNLNLVVKADANSLYGVSASQYFSLHDVDIAEDITRTAKHYCCITDYAINEFFRDWGPKELAIIQQKYPEVTKLVPLDYKRDVPYHDVCNYGDTDSRHIDFELITKMMLTSSGKNMTYLLEDREKLIELGLFFVDNFLNSLIRTRLDNECEYRNAEKGLLVMTHETIAQKCVFIKKKMYVLTNIWADGRTLPSPKIKYQGVEIKKGQMSEKIKKILKKLLENYLINNYTIDNLRDDVVVIMNLIRNKNDFEYACRISRVSGLDAIYLDDSGNYRSEKTHIEMQIAMSWLQFIKDNQLGDQYRPPFEGQKMFNYYCDSKSGIKIIGIPDDVDISTIKELPKPDWNEMLYRNLLKPLLRYILDVEEVEPIDAEKFLLNVQEIKI